MPSSVQSSAAEQELVDEMSTFYADPLGFVLFAFPWQEPGELRLFNGPDDWQRELLEKVGEEVKKRRFKL